jgi:hypothetical protein
LGFFFLKTDYANEAYDALRKELGLRHAQTLFRRTLSGEVDGASLGIQGERDGTIVEVIVRTRDAPKDLHLFPADGFSYSAVPTLDPGFDRKVHVGGQRVRVAAMFDEATRDAIASVIWDHRAVFTNGAFVLGSAACGTVTGGRLAGEIDGRRFARFLRRVLRLSERLAERAAMAVRPLLLENVVRDPRIGVRQHNLQLLIDRFPESAETLTAAQSVLAHHDYSLRLLGSVHLARRTPADVAPLLDLIRDRRAPLEVRERALFRMLELSSIEGRRALLSEVLDAGDALVRRALLECKKRVEPPPDELLGSLLLTANPEIVADVIRYVADQGHRQHEPLLIRILEGDDVAAKFAAVDALGRIGTAHAAEALRELAGGILTTARLRRASLDAIESIRIRGGYDAGRLSLAEIRDGGEISLTACGEVSLPD